MAYLIVPNMRDEKIVCQQRCEHIDCAAMRKDFIMAECEICHNRFLSGESFCYLEHGTNRKAHFRCL